MNLAGDKKTCAPRFFDLASREHDQELKTWCSFHWQDTFSRAVKSRNAPTYHDCCVCFSRRGFVKNVSHPKLQSASLLQIPTLKNMESPEELYRWLKERLQLHYRLGKQPYFPSINVAHFAEEDSICGLQQDCEEELLAKRQVELAADKKKLEEELSQLREENRKLLSSSKMWCDKYLQLLHQGEAEVDSMQLTPMKKSKTTETDDNLISF